jgi:hypothetical protein
MASGLRINTMDKVATTKYRCRSATVWGVPDGSAALDVTTESDDRLDSLGSCGPPDADAAVPCCDAQAAQAAIDIISGETQTDDGITQADTAALR